MANSNFKVKNGLEVSDQLFVYDETNASTSEIASVVIAGGIGVAKDIIVDGDVVVDGVSVRSISASGTILEDWYVVSKTGDNTTAIQNKLNQARDNGGGTVYIATKETPYDITSTLRIYNNTNLILGQGVEVRRANAALTYLIVNGNANSNDYLGQKNITIQGGLWNMRGNESTYQTLGSYCIGLAHGDNITIKNLTVKNVTGESGVGINGCQNVTVENSKFLGYRSVSGSQAEAVKIDVMKDSAAFAIFGNYDNTPCKNITIKDCYFGPSGDSGTTSWHKGVGTRNSVSSVFHTGIRISNNYFDSLLGESIYAIGHRELNISLNTLRACLSGITVDVGSPEVLSNQIVIDNNTFSNIVGTATNKDASVYLKGSASNKHVNVVISNNGFFNGGSSGTSSVIQALNVNSLNILGNSFTTFNCNATLSGAIQLNNCNTSNISNNIISSITNGNGILTIESNDVSIFNNKIDGIGRNSIYLQNTQRCSVSNNLMKDSSLTTNNLFFYIRLLNADDSLISANYARATQSNKPANALNIDSSSERVTLWGNDFLGSSVSATIVNNGVNSKTTVDNR